MTSSEDGSFINWQGQLPQKEQPQIEAILDKRVSKKTKDKIFSVFGQVEGSTISRCSVDDRTGDFQVQCTS